MPDLPVLAAAFFRTEAGREPAREWLRELPAEERKTIGGDIYLVQWRWPVGRPLVAHLRDGIWEVRSNLENRIARVLFAVSGSRMIILHGFIKKTRDTPDEEIELAARRWKIWKNEQGTRSE